jgi:hypothetical protein
MEMLGDFNSKVEREYIFKPTIRNKSLHEISNGSGITIANFVTSKSLIVTSTMFPHHITSFINTPGLLLIEKQSYLYILIDKR